MALATAAGQALEALTRPVTIEVLVGTRTPDGAGGGTTTWAVAATFPGRVTPSTRDPASVNVAATSKVSQLWEIAGPVGVSVSTAARLRVQGTTSPVYAVIGDDEPRSYSIGAHFLCYEVG